MMEFDPRKMEFWTPANVEEQFGLDKLVPADGKIETCCTVFPAVEIGTYQTPPDMILPLFVYATITRQNGVEWRAALTTRDTGRLRRVHVDARGKREWL